MLKLLVKAYKENILKSNYSDFSRYDSNISGNVGVKNRRYIKLNTLKKIKQPSGAGEMAQ